MLEIGKRKFAVRGAEVYLVQNMKGRTSWGPSVRWESNIKVDITEVEYKDFDLFDMVQDMLKWQTVVEKLKSFRSLSKSGNYFLIL